MLKPWIITASATLLSLLGFTACDFQPDQTKEIAGGYRLYKDDDVFAIFEGRSGAGSRITQIGWRKPFVIAAIEGGRYELFDTATHKSQLWLSADQVQADSRIRDIPLISPEDAWKQLDHDKGQW